MLFIQCNRGMVGAHHIQFNLLNTSIFHRLALRGHQGRANSLSPMLFQHHDSHACTMMIPFIGTNRNRTAYACQLSLYERAQQYRIGIKLDLFNKLNFLSNGQTQLIRIACQIKRLTHTRMHQPDRLRCIIRLQAAHNQRLPALSICFRKILHAPPSSMRCDFPYYIRICIQKTAPHRRRAAVSVFRIPRDLPVPESRGRRLQYVFRCPCSFSACGSAHRIRSASVRPSGAPSHVR